MAASLDSLVLGEPQILGQLKQAFELARRTGTIGARLSRTMPRAIRAAKRVRTETSVGAGQVSVPSVAVDLARQIFGELEQHTAVLVGSGEIAETVARLLASERVELLVVGRDEARVGELTARVGGLPRLFADLDQALLEADVVITSTSAPHYVVDQRRMQAVHRARRGRSLFFIDLAVPRDVDPRIGDLDRVFVYNIDDFSRLVAESFSTRRREAELAEQIVAREAEGFDRWLDATEQVTPAVVTLRSRFEQVLTEELERSLRGRLKHLGQEERRALAKMSEAVLNKLLHAPTTRLRQVAWDQADGGLHTEQLLSALEELFGLPLQDLAEPGESPVGAEPSASEEGADQASAPGASEPDDATAAPAGLRRGRSGVRPR